MGLKSRISRLEKSGKLEPARRDIFVEVFAPDDTPRNEEQARILKEGEEAEARGENIFWIYIRMPREARLPDQHC